MQFTTAAYKQQQVGQLIHGEDNILSSPLLLIVKYFSKIFLLMSDPDGDKPSISAISNLITAEIEDVPRSHTKNYQNPIIKSADY